MKRKQEYKVKSEYSMALGNRLKQLRMAKQLSQTDVCDLIDRECNVVTLSRYENGVREPSTHLLEKLAVIYDTNMGYILEGIDHLKKENEVEKIKNEFTKSKKILRELMIELFGCNTRTLEDVLKYIRFLHHKDDLENNS